MGGFPIVRRSLRDPGRFVPPPLWAGCVRPGVPDELQSFGRDVLCKLGEEVGGDEHMDVLGEYTVWLQSSLKKLLCSHRDIRAKRSSCFTSETLLPLAT